MLDDVSDLELHLLSTGLAQRRHPDLTTFPTERHRRTAPMQRINLACD
jgi:hypothetical protein